MAAVEAAEDEPAPAIIGYEEARAILLKWIGCAKSRYHGPAKRKATNAHQRIAVCSDLHVPFHEPEYVAEMFEDTAGADLLVVAGDLADSYALSRFLKYEHVPIETEMAALEVFLEQASERYPKVIVLEGNHGLSRLEKSLIAHNDEQVIAAVRLLTGGSFSLLQAACRQFPNVEMGHTQVGRFDLDWLVQIGDAIICHAEKFSVVPGSAMRKVEEWLADQEQSLNLNPWRVVMQAHTHQISMFPWHADKLLIELGCLCSLHGYQLTAKIGGRPQRRGWWSLDQVNGQTDTDSLLMRWRGCHRRAA